MSRLQATKSKPPPWIPPGKGNQKAKKTAKVVTKVKSADGAKTIISLEDTFVLEKKEDDKVDEPDNASLSSNSSAGIENKPNIFIISIYQEMKILYINFASLKTSYLSTHRLIDFQSIEDTSVDELLSQIENAIKDINNLFEDLEYSVCVLENTLDAEKKMNQFAEVFKNKEKLFSKLFELFGNVIIVFQTIFEKLDFREMSELQESLRRKLQIAEKRSMSQEAVIKDLERRLSIYQSKTSAMEGYKTNLENAKSDLEKQLLYKDTQIKHLSNELLDASKNQVKTDHEYLLEIMEGMKSKAHSDKSALKKALKFQKLQFEKSEEKYQKLIQETHEKEKLVFDIAAQRDQLKVQLTVINNNLIEQKTQIEQLKIQNQKLQNEVDEKDVSQKKELRELQNALEDKSSLLENALKAKKTLENSIEELENELQTTKMQLKNLKKETEVIGSSTMYESEKSDVMLEAMNRLTSLLQNTKQIFENLNIPTHAVSAGGDHLTAKQALDGVENEILVAVKETREHLLDLKNLYKSFLQEQKNEPVPQRKNQLEKQLKKLEEMYKDSLKENQNLKSELEELKNASPACTGVKRSENYITSNMPADNFTRKLQLELVKKSDEILKLKYEFKQKERDLEDQLKEYKDKNKLMEVDSSKLAGLEEELKNVKKELTMLQEKKEEETERLMRRTKELQDSLDLKSAEYESLQRYVQLLKSSYFNVFGGS